MVAPQPSPRVIGVSLPDVSDWREPLPAGKWSQFFSALSTRTTLVDVITPRLSVRDRYLNLARSARPGKAAWLAQAGFNLRHLGPLNAAVERELMSRRGSYDLIVQLQTLCTPRSASLRTPYVIYTDNTMALTQSVYPALAPLSSAAVGRWQAFESAVCRQAEAVFTFSEFARRSMIHDYGCPADDVLAVGAGANQLLPSLEGRRYGQRRALFVGSPFAPKGGEILLSAWRLVRKHLPDAELILVGPKANPVGSRDSGVTYRGRIDRGELAQLYKSASVFVLPSMFDAWGHVFVEAMGHGLPCIGCDCCAMPELIEDGVSGLLVPRADPASLATALIELLIDPARAGVMGHAGYERVKRELTWDHVADRLVRRLSDGQPARSQAPSRHV